MAINWNWWKGALRFLFIESPREHIVCLFVNIIVFGHIWVTPFTKVEESFNLQACHDILYHGWNLDKYDHHQFPGVVPRTFLGPLVVSIFVWPLKFFLFLTKTGTQKAVRFYVGNRIIHGISHFGDAVGGFGAPPSRFYRLKRWMMLIYVSQFHLHFYASRTLPNIFALAIVFHAFIAYAKGNTQKFVMISAVAILIFRAELAVLCGLMLIYHLLEEDTENRLRLTFLYGISAVAVCVPVSVVIDSIFWRRLVWPELEVFYFNAVLNKSGEWGVMPFTWYFYSALPRIFMTSLPFLFLYPSISRRTEMYKYFVPALAFIFLYSGLPHKELRFIIYTIPLLNYCLAAVFSTIWMRRHENLKWKLGCYAMILSLLTNFLLTCGLTYVSSHNYPGGDALTQLHEIEDPSSLVKVHMDVTSCQTGVSRFLEANPSWVYDKTENLTNQELIDEFTHLIILKDDFNRPRNLLLRESFRVIAEARGIDALKDIFPVRISPTNSAILVVKRKFI
eukprot:TRINITY_DN6989_c0_g1_i1.p1 TRINITY_DN6989_c0_g1~~TRINITY_DN6989_c0_g1_i1.p1  ORF type:complete len:506 (-),score=46.78 TRINITY_DN6989_c0_g1_i1:142-1659(-)